MAVVLARLAAQKEVRQRIKKSGGNLSLIPYARLTRLANEWLEAHPELIAEALADPIVVQMSQVSNRKRRPAAQGLPLCKSQVQKSALTREPQHSKIEEGQ